MNRLILVVLIVTSGVIYSQENTTTLTWLTNIEKAKKISKKTKKPILVYFNGSDWCGPCIKLKEDFFNTNEFVEKSNDLILVMIDKPRRVDIISEKQMEYNNKVITKYNPQKAFPKLVILNHKGKIIDAMSGYSYYGDTSNHFAFINKHI